MNQQVKTVASSQECVGEPANLARVHWRRRGQSPTCVSKLNECTEKDECTEIVSGKVSRANTQELIIYKKGGQTTRKSALKCAGSSRYLQKKVPITM
jgi:hypothetical protein